MVNKRDYVVEILNKRSRTPKQTTRYEQFLTRYTLIVEAFEFLRVQRHINREVKIELLKYISIGSVACIEGYFRTAMKDLIDCGLPFTDNAKKLDNNIKFDLETVFKLGSAKVSIGEFISHLPSMSSLDDINRTMSKIIDSDFLNSVKEFKHEEFGKLEDTAKYLKEDIDNVFYSRHIYCHEIAVRVKPTLKQAEDHIGATLTFVDTTEAMLQEKIEAALQKKMPPGKPHR